MNIFVVLVDKYPVVQVQDVEWWPEGRSYCKLTKNINFYQNIIVKVNNSVVTKKNQKKNFSTPAGGHNDEDSPETYSRRPFNIIWLWWQPAATARFWKAQENSRRPPGFHISRLLWTQLQQLLSRGIAGSPRWCEEKSLGVDSPKQQSCNSVRVTFQCWCVSCSHASDGHVNISA